VLPPPLLLRSGQLLLNNKVPRIDSVPITTTLSGGINSYGLAKLRA